MLIFCIFDIFSLLLQHWEEGQPCSVQARWCRRRTCCCDCDPRLISKTLFCKQAWFAAYKEHQARRYQGWAQAGSRSQRSHRWLEGMDKEPRAKQGWQRLEDRASSRWAQDRCAWRLSCPDAAHALMRCMPVSCQWAKPMNECNRVISSDSNHNMQNNIQKICRICKIICQICQRICKIFKIVHRIWQTICRICKQYAEYTMKYAEYAIKYVQ